MDRGNKSGDGKIEKGRQGGYRSHPRGYKRRKEKTRTEDSIHALPIDSIDRVIPSEDERGDKYCHPAIEDRSGIQPSDDQRGDEYSNSRIKAGDGFKPPIDEGRGESQPRSIGRGDKS